MTTTTETRLMPAEAACAHLAQFARGDRVTVGGRIYPSETGIVTGPQRHDFSHILRSDITVSVGEGNDERVLVITVASHLCGHRTIERAA
jgi:hypothetical protein